MVDVVGCFVMEVVMNDVGFVVRSDLMVFVLIVMFVCGVGVDVDVLVVTVDDDC